MNWKLVATLMVGSALLTACGASNSAPVNDSGTRTNTTDVAPGGTKPTAADPAAAPAPAAPTTEDAKKPIVIHD